MPRCLREAVWVAQYVGDVALATCNTGVGLRVGWMAAHAHETEILQERLTAMSVELERLRLSAAFAPPQYAHRTAASVEAAGEARAHAALEASVRGSGMLTGRLRAGEGEGAAAAGGHAMSVSGAVPVPHAARHHSRTEQVGADAAGGADGGWGVVEAVDQPRAHAPLPVPLDAGSRHFPPAHAGAGPGGSGNISLLAIKQVRFRRLRNAHWLAAPACRSCASSFIFSPPPSCPSSSRPAQP